MSLLVSFSIQLNPGPMLVLKRSPPRYVLNITTKKKKLTAVSTTQRDEIMTAIKACRLAKVTAINILVASGFSIEAHLCSSETALRSVGRSTHFKRYSLYS
jgi:hypothetical protein